MPALPLSPWMRGPYDLIEHAQGHLASGKDIDWKLALVGFDQAIEITIHTFLQRGAPGPGWPPILLVEKDNALAGFNSMIGFLERYTRKRGLQMNARSEDIKHYHKTRNTLNPSSVELRSATGGGGVSRVAGSSWRDLVHERWDLVPEIADIEGAKAAAIEIFRLVFERDISADPLARAGKQRAEETPVWNEDTLLATLASQHGPVAEGAARRFLEYARESCDRIE